MTLMMPSAQEQVFPVFDFRSQRFCDDALALARATGCPLEQCRQELFIAEGDVELAHEVLVTGYNCGDDGLLLH